MINRLTHKDIYSGEKLIKLRSSVPLNTVTSIDIVTGTDIEGLPSEHAIAISHTNDQTATFCFNDVESMQDFYDQLNWRVSAVNRSYKYDETSHETSSDDITTTKSKGKRRKNKTFRGLR